MCHQRLPSILAGIIVPAVLACAPDQAPAPSPRHNVVLVVVDTLRADYADPTSKKAHLPNLAEFAAGAVAFQEAFTHAPVTLPAHAALFSARAPLRAGVTNNGQTVPQDLPLLQDWLKSRGYANQAAVSLATLWPHSRNQGVDRGFEHFSRGGEPITGAADMNRDLGSILDSLREKSPFFLFAHYAEPHEPYEAHGATRSEATLEWNSAPLEVLTISEWTTPQRELQLVPGVNRLAIRSAQNFKVRALTFQASGTSLPVSIEVGALLAEQRELVATVVNGSSQTRAARMNLWMHDAPAIEELPARYRGEAEAADAAFGQLIAMLKERELFDSTLIVFTSDHGEALGEHDTIGHVVNLYDELLRVPLLIKLPAGHPGRPRLERSKRDLVRLIDVAPTILDVLDVEAMPGQEGSSLLESSARTLLAQTFAPEAPRTLFALRDLRTKLIFDVSADSFRMYDLIADPGELHDIFPRSGSQRIPWQAELRRRAASAAAAGVGMHLLDAAAQERLRSLGY